MIAEAEVKLHMAKGNCATCRFYRADGSGKGYCMLKDKTVRHEGSCSDYEED